MSNAALLYPPPRSKSDAEPWVDIKSAAAHLGVSVRWLYHEADRHGVPCSRFGKSRRYKLSRLDEWAMKQEVGVA